MGLPIERLVIGTNANDILARYLRSGDDDDRGGRAEPQPEHGHPGREQFRAAAVRAEGPQRRRGGRSDAAVPRDAAPCRPTSRLARARARCSPAHRVDDARRSPTIGRDLSPHAAC